MVNQSESKHDPLTLQTGSPAPYGPTRTPSGVNFSLYAPQVDQIELLLYVPSGSDQVEEIARIALHPEEHCTGDIWHVEVIGLPLCFCYAYQVEGFPPTVDPYSPDLFVPGAFGAVSNPLQGDSRFYAPLSLVQFDSPFDWEGVSPPEIPKNELILYEMHLRGFTRDDSSSVDFPGSYLGMIEKIPYLVDLGINAVEILPLFEFNELEYSRCYQGCPNTLLNYWGYSPVHFFAPMGRYASASGPGVASKELKQLIRELHRHGIEVILDVVFNHTAEGGPLGPTYSYKAYAEDTYYIKNDEGHYQDFTGCGNTFNCNHPIAMELIIAALRHWVSEYHIDGFRFDLASAMTRDIDGMPLDRPPLIRAMNVDPLLKETKFIAEPWDIGGLYHVGHFPLKEGRWSEWNGQYRDDVRSFIKGDREYKGRFASRLTGSSDLYHSSGSPLHSINFITCHDGFSLQDLVSYNNKHNLLNGEDGRDGNNHNLSWNCGYEGDPIDQKIELLRRAQVKNYLLTLLLSEGIPMLRMGDEYGHTQKGNNNTYCQDNELSWFDWEKAEDSPLLKFVKKLIHLRKNHPALQKGSFHDEREVLWHGMVPEKPDWQADNGFVALTLLDPEEKEDLYIAFNAEDVARDIELPKLSDEDAWHPVIDTSKAFPQDFIGVDEESPLEVHRLVIPSYSALLLKAKKSAPSQPRQKA